MTKDEALRRAHKLDLQRHDAHKRARVALRRTRQARQDLLNAMTLYMAARDDRPGMQLLVTEYYRHDVDEAVAFQRTGEK
jgi:hypothetical protein